MKVKKLTSKAIFPLYSHPGDSGMDLFSVVDVEVASGQAKLIPTGISIELPPKTEAQVRPRSGLALKHQITVLNSPGTIDEGYRGEIGVIIINHGPKSFYVTEGMKIAQLVVKPTITVEIIQSNDLSETQRGEGGFGSTGN